MDWDHLRVFLAVARSGQLLGAARKLGVNHATVARQLDALEASLGTLLFDRRPSGTVLTEAEVIEVAKAGGRLIVSPNTDTSVIASTAAFVAL